MLFSIMLKAKRRPGGDFCSAVNCKNARQKETCKELSFFRFPSDEERCRIWVQNSCRLDLIGKPAKVLSVGGYHLCSKHFESSQFNVPAERKRLVWNAVPTLFDVPNPPPPVTVKRKLKDRSSTKVSQKKLCRHADTAATTQVVIGFQLISHSRYSSCIKFRKDNKFKLTASSLCSSHFLPDDYIGGPTTLGGMMRQRKCLEPGAVPSVFPRSMLMFETTIISEKNGLLHDKGRLAVGGTIYCSSWHSG